jgi:hypothetical protein
VPVLSSSVSWLTLKFSLFDAADSNLAERPRSAGDGEIDHLDVVAAVDPDLSAVGLHEVCDVPGPAPTAGQAERQDRAHGRCGRVRDVDDVHDRAEVERLTIVDDDQRVAAQIDVLALEVGEGKSGHHLRGIRSRDVEDRDPAPAADEGVVILEVHAGSTPRNVTDQVHVARGSKRGRDNLTGGRHGAEEGDERSQRQERHKRLDSSARRSFMLG